MKQGGGSHLDLTFSLISLLTPLELPKEKEGIQRQSGSEEEIQLAVSHYTCKATSLPPRKNVYLSLVQMNILLKCNAVVLCAKKQGHFIVWI